MKMLWLGLLLIFLGALSMGCGFFQLLGPQDILGRYTYINSKEYARVTQREIPIWIDHSFGQADLVEISKAVEQWNFVLNGYLHLTIVDTHFDMQVSQITESVKKGGWLIIKLQGIDQLVPVSNDKKLWVLAFVEQIGGSHMYLVRDRLENADIFGITMHEIGHLLGSPHVGHKLMYYKFSRYRYQCVDLETATAVALHNGIPAEDLNYCVDKNSGDINQKPSTSADEESGYPLE